MCVCLNAREREREMHLEVCKYSNVKASKSCHGNSFAWSDDFHTGSLAQEKGRFPYCGVSECRSNHGLIEIDLNFKWREITWYWRPLNPRLTLLARFNGTFGSLFSWYGPLWWKTLERNHDKNTKCFLKRAGSSGRQLECKCITLSLILNVIVFSFSRHWTKQHWLHQTSKYKHCLT